MKSSPELRQEAWRWIEAVTNTVSKEESRQLMARAFELAQMAALRSALVIEFRLNGKPPNFLSDFDYVPPNIGLAPLSLKLSLAGFVPEKL